MNTTCKRFLLETSRHCYCYCIFNGLKANSTFALIAFHCSLEDNLNLVNQQLNPKCLKKRKHLRSDQRSNLTHKNYFHFKTSCSAVFCFYHVYPSIEITQKFYTKWDRMNDKFVHWLYHYQAFMLSFQKRPWPSKIANLLKNKL